MKLVALFVKRGAFFVNKQIISFDPCPFLSVSLCSAIPQVPDLPFGMRSFALSFVDGFEELPYPLHETAPFLCIIWA